MRKKILLLVLIILVLATSIYSYIDYQNKGIRNLEITNQKDIVLNVYEEYYYEDYISIEGYEILSNNLFDTNTVGEHEISVLFVDENNRKYIGIIKYRVVDDIAPIILGGSTLTIVKGSDIDLKYSFISADNYDSSPIREIIGDYDINKTGNYDLKLEVIDHSNNITSHDFTLKVVETTTTYTPKPTYTYYEDVIETYKTEDNKIGLDISKWQGDIDFEKIKEAGVEFVMVRVGYQNGFNGEYVIDPYFNSNIQKLNELNIDVGIYFYSYATTVEEAKVQALWVIEKIKNYDIKLPVAFDFEKWSNFSSLNLSLHDINEIAKTFIETLNSYKYIGINYSSKYYLENIWEIDEYPTWLAHYTTKTDYAGEYIIWQLCNNGIIDGIDGYVDIDILQY